MSYHSLLYHIVFRPRKSVPAITETYERDLYMYIYGFMKQKGFLLYRINGMPDHLHLLVDLPPTVCISDFVRDLKTSTYFFMEKNKGKFPLFEGWAESYAAFSYSVKDKDTVIRYIMNQKEHHKHVSFSDELRKLLNEEGIAFEEKYFLK